MFRPFLFSLAFLQSISALHAQREMPQSTRDAINYGTFNPHPTHTIYGRSAEEGGVEGDAYLDTAWHLADVWFVPAVVRRYDPGASDSVSGYAVRVDLFNQLVEFRIDDTIKGIDYGAIRSIRYQTAQGEQVSLFNTQHFGVDQKALPGFFRTLAAGKLTLYRYTRLIIREPTYNVALDVGNKNRTLQKREEYFAATARPGLEKIRLNKKQLLGLMKGAESEVEQFVAQERLDWGKEADVTRVVHWYNIRSEGEGVKEGSRNPALRTHK